MRYDHTGHELKEQKVRSGIDYFIEWTSIGEPFKCSVHPISSEWIQKTPGFKQEDTFRVFTMNRHLQPGTILQLSGMTKRVKVISGINYGHQSSMVVTVL